MVQDIDSAMNYFEDSLGFDIWRTPNKGVLDGTLTASMSLGDMSYLEFLSMKEKETSDKYVWRTVALEMTKITP